MRGILGVSEVRSIVPLILLCIVLSSCSMVDVQKSMILPSQREQLDLSSQSHITSCNSISPLALDAKRQIVRVLLPSVGTKNGFSILSNDQVTDQGNLKQVRVGNTPLFDHDIALGSVFTMPIPIDGLPTIDLDFIVNPGTKTSTQSEQRFFTAEIVNDPDNPEGTSFATFTFLPNSRDGRQAGRLSGILIRNYGLEETSTSWIRNNWYFIEPLWPLLDQAARIKSEMNCVGIFNALFPESAEAEFNHHISYEMRNLDFLTEFDPDNVQEHLIEEASYWSNEPVVESSATAGSPVADCSSKCEPIDVSIYYDNAFLETHKNHKNAVMAIEAVTNLTVSIPEGDTIEGTSIYRRYGAPVELTIHTGAVQLVNLDLSGLGSEPNAYQIMCVFRESSPTTSTATSTTLSNEVVHLFSGLQFGKLPDDKAISDIGSDWCEMGCGGNSSGTRVIGLSEGIGGFGIATNPANDAACKDSSYEKLESFHPAQHSISQQVLLKDNTGKTKNYDGILAQRWMVFVHEIGHNLGATHSPKSKTKGVKSIMDPTVSASQMYMLPADKASEIEHCIAVRKSSSASSTTTLCKTM